jgi:hypothetical protein
VSDGDVSDPLFERGDLVADAEAGGVFKRGSEQFGLLVVAEYDLDQVVEFEAEFPEGSELDADWKILASIFRPR